MAEPRPLTGANALRDDGNGPLLFFDDAPISLHYGGIIAITLSVVRHQGTVEARLESRNTVAAQLRTNIQGARALRKALDDALLLAAPAQGQTQ